MQIKNEMTACFDEKRIKSHVLQVYLTQSEELIDSTDKAFNKGAVTELKLFGDLFQLLKVNSNLLNKFLSFLQKNCPDLTHIGITYTVPTERVFTTVPIASLHFLLQFKRCLDSNWSDEDSIKKMLMFSFHKDTGSFLREIVNRYKHTMPLGVVYILNLNRPTRGYPDYIIHQLYRLHLNKKEYRELTHSCLSYLKENSLNDFNALIERAFTTKQCFFSPKVTSNFSSYKHQQKFYAMLQSQLTKEQALLTESPSIVRF